MTPARRRGSWRPIWFWPLLLLPPALVALAWLPRAAPSLTLLLLGLSLAALPLIRGAVEGRVQREPTTDARLDSVLAYAWLQGGATRALDVAMTRLLLIGALEWAYTPTRQVWQYHPVAGIAAPAELKLLQQLCAGGAHPWQLQVLATGALGAAQWTLVERGWWIDRWTALWARLWSSLPLALVWLSSLAVLPAAIVAGQGAMLLFAQALGLSALIANAAYAPARTRRGRRAVAAWSPPATNDPVEALAWRVAREGSAALAGSAAERWAEIRARGADRRP
jgi:uncharacterized protein (TIGR04222 family)